MLTICCLMMAEENATILIFAIITCGITMEISSLKSTKNVSMSSSSFYVGRYKHNLMRPLWIRNDGTINIFKPHGTNITKMACDDHDNHAVKN